MAEDERHVTERDQTSEQGVDEGGGPPADQGSEGTPGVSGRLTSDLRPEHAEPTPRTAPDEDDS
jgi:hypothetical protein